MSNSSFYHQAVRWKDAEDTLRHIRTRVFMDEQQVSAADEWDGQDDAAVHFLTRLEDGRAVATARVLLEAEASINCYHIGRVAVLPEYRQQCVGRSLMAYVVNWCLDHSPDAPLYLHAQITRIAFYKHLGFVPQGTEFMDAGIPHITMWYRRHQ